MSGCVASADGLCAWFGMCPFLKRYIFEYFKINDLVAKRFIFIDLDLLLAASCSCSCQAVCLPGSGLTVSHLFVLY